MAVKNNVKQEEIPTVLIISDMEFNGAVRSSNGSHADNTLFETIGKRWQTRGYTLPRLVFWNVNSRTGAIPVKQNEMGCALVSGFSANLAKMVCSNELDPFKALVNILTAERYAKVTLQ